MLQLGKYLKGEKTLLLFFFLIFITNQSLAQLGNTYRIVNHKIEPISYASILFINSSKGTITNATGYFKVPIEYPNEINISHIGYKPMKVNLDTVSNNIIILHEEVITLNEIKVSPTNARQIVKNALIAIDSNFTKAIIFQKAFYRECLYEYKILTKATESELILQKQSYQSKNKNDIVYIDRGRSFVYDSTNTDVLNGIISIFDQCDIVKNRTYILNTESMEHHNFSLQSIINYNNCIAYQIKFYPKDRKRISLHKRYTGELIIDTSNLTFLEATVKQFGSHDIGNNLNVRYLKSNLGYTLSSATKQVFKGNRSAEIALSITDFQCDTLKPNLPLIKKGIPLTNYLENTISDRLIILPDTVKQQNLTNSNFPKTYNPSIELYWGNHFSNQIGLTASTINSANYLVDYFLSSKVKNGMIWSFSQTLYHLSISNPLSMVLAESNVLKKNNISHKIAPTNLNNSLTSHYNEVTNKELEIFHSKNNIDFLRLHSVRNEMLYSMTSKIEENLFLNNYIINSYSNVFFIDLFMKRSTLFFNQFMVGQEMIKLKKFNYYNDRMLTEIYFLSTQNSSFPQTISNSDLNSNGIKMMKRVKWSSFINLISPYIIGKQELNVSPNLKMNFSLGFLLTPLGEAYIQNYWFKVNDDPYKLDITVFNSKNLIGYSLGLEMFKKQITKKINISTKVEYWNQPQNLNYNATKLESGFRIDQKLKYKLSNKSAFMIGYSLKTRGYVTDNLATESDNTVKFGLQIFLN